MPHKQNPVGCALTLAAANRVPGLVAKDGADGGYAAALPDGSAVAFKVLDGSARPRPVVLAAALAVAGVDPALVEAVGLTPKRFARVCRFQRALGELARSPGSLAEVAATCGYFDQSHFIHEFRAFAGATPSDYRARRCRVHVRVDRAEIYNPI